MENGLPQYVNDVKLYFTLLKESIGLFKSAKELLPDSPQKEKLEIALKEAELQARVAEANLAKNLGFNLCPKCWPPSILKAIMVSANQDNYHCDSCDTFFVNHGKRRGPDVVNLREYVPGNKSNQ